MNRPTVISRLAPGVHSLTGFFQSNMVAFKILEPQQDEVGHAESMGGTSFGPFLGRFPAALKTEGVGTGLQIVEIETDPERILAAETEVERCPEGLVIEKGLIHAA